VPYKIEYSPDVLDHLQALTARQRRTLLDAAELQLSYEPNIETRNRKRMRPNALAPWELRVGNLRVYYDIQEDPESVVVVLAMGVKVRNRVFIGGKEFEL
jgi:mRNA-degrading endonuclease RelE of RelBE toxin-antitoxin system